MPADGLAPVLVGAIKAFAIIYEYLTWPIYYFTYRPDERLKASARVRAVPMADDPSGPYRCVETPESGLTTTLFPGCDTLDDLYTRAANLWPDARALGTRKLVSEEEEVQPNGRVFKKLTFAEYQWETFKEVHERIDAFGFGLLALGQKPGSNVLIFAETRAEWMIAAQTCLRFGIPLVTLYATLGDEAVVYGVNEAEVSVVITSASLVNKLASLLPRMSTVKHLIYMNHAVLGGSESLDVKKASDKCSPVQLHSMMEVETVGSRPENREKRPPRPERQALAVIMYTSGSTGLPKGVMISHANLMCGMSGQGPRIIGLGPGDTYIGYLPLAHVLELSAEVCCLAMGTCIGYSNPATMTDLSPKIKRGTRGDASVLKPTLMAAVPVIMDRIYKNVWEKARDGGEVALQLFTWAYEYKKARLESGVGSFFLDKFVFRRIRSLLGGRVRMMLCGGAPLAQDTQRFMNIVFDCPILQGYGLTETVGAGTIASCDDLSTGRCGAPLTCVEIKLRDWEEGGYKATDKPEPRGEILLGGGNITMGYYKQPEKTAEDFFTDKNGQRWFCSGDIGSFNSDGTLAIVDRKKDLVKLQAGEYVSLGKVETAVSLSPYVESACAYGDGLRTYMVALVVPKRKPLDQLADKLGLKIEGDGDAERLQRLCDTKEVQQAVLKDMQAMAAKKGLERFEIPQKLTLCPDTWTPDTGLVTDAFKLKRKPIQEKYQREIDLMYG